MKEDLIFCSMGNGVSVCDRNREEHSDYRTVAHISRGRKVTYYDKNLPRETVRSIDWYAKYGNASASATQLRPVLKPVEFSQMDVSKLERIFKTALEPYPQFTGATPEAATFPACGKTIIHSTKEVCLFFRDYYRYMVTDLSPREDSWILVIYDRANDNSQGYITDY